MSDSLMEVLKQISKESDEDSQNIINNRKRNSILVKENISNKNKLSNIYYLYDNKDNIKYTIKLNKSIITKSYLYDKDNNKIAKLIKINNYIFYNNKLINGNIDIKSDRKYNKTIYVIYYKGKNIINMIDLDYLDKDIYNKYLYEIKDKTNEILAILLASVLE